MAIFVIPPLNKRLNPLHHGQWITIEDKRPMCATLLTWATIAIVKSALLEWLRWPKKEIYYTYFKLCVISLWNANGFRIIMHDAQQQTKTESKLVTWVTQVAKKKISHTYLKLRIILLCNANGFCNCHYWIYEMNPRQNFQWTSNFHVFLWNMPKSLDHLSSHYLGYTSIWILRYLFALHRYPYHLEKKFKKFRLQYMIVNQKYQIANAIFMLTIV